jgi:hypothetical protein
MQKTPSAFNKSSRMSLFTFLSRIKLQYNTKLANLVLLLFCYKLLSHLNPAAPLTICGLFINQLHRLTKIFSNSSRSLSGLFANDSLNSG